MKKRTYGLLQQGRIAANHYVITCTGGEPQYFGKCDLEQRKRFSDGKVSLPYKHFLGYELEQKKENKLSKRKALDRFISDLSKRDELLTEFDNCLWLTVADKVTVRKDGTLVFKFNDGTEIKG